MQNDKHLNLEIVFITESMERDSQRISVSTKVRFHNSLGKCYFATIKPFHNLICKTLLQRTKTILKISLQISIVMCQQSIKNMNTDYKVGDFIYNADIYDGLNNSLSDLEFYKNGYLKIKMPKYLNSAVVRVDLRFQ